MSLNRPPSVVGSADLPTLDEQLAILHELLLLCEPGVSVAWCFRGCHKQVQVVVVVSSTNEAAMSWYLLHSSL